MNRRMAASSSLSRVSSLRRSVRVRSGAALRFAVGIGENVCSSATARNIIGGARELPIFPSAYLTDDLALARVDFLEVADALLPDVVANHPLALGRQLIHVDPRRVNRTCAVCNDARLEQGLDQDAKDVGGFLQIGASVSIG